MAAIPRGGNPIGFARILVKAGTDCDSARGRGSLNSQKILEKYVVVA
jgi:hypothetical protein